MAVQALVTPAVVKTAGVTAVKVFAAKTAIELAMIVPAIGLIVGGVWVANKIADRMS